MDFDDGKSSDDINNNATMSDDEVVASYGPSRSLFLLKFTSQFASECESNATSEPDLSTEPDPAPDRRSKKWRHFILK